MIPQTAQPATGSRTPRERIAVFCDRALYPVLLALFLTTAFLKVAASIALSLAIILFAMHRSLTRTPLMFGRVRIYYAVLLACGASMLLSLLNTQDMLSGVSLLRTTAWKLLIAVVIIEAVRDRDGVRRLLWAYAAGCALLALMTLYQGLVQHVWRPPTMWIAVHAGNLLMFGLVAMIALFLHEQGARSRSGLTVMVLLTLGAIYLNGTRGVWVAVAVIMLLIPLVIPRATMKQKLAAYGIIVLVLAGASQTPFVREKFREARSNIESYRNADARTSLGYRIDMWKASATLFRERPVIGAGTGDWQYEVRRLVREGKAPESIKDYNQTHNIFLDALSTQGLIGVASLAALLIAPVVVAGRNDGHTLARPLVVLTTAAFFVSGMSDTLTHIRGVFTSYLMLVAAALALAADRASPERQEAR